MNRNIFVIGCLLIVACVPPPQTGNVNPAQPVPATTEEQKTVDEFVPIVGEPSTTTPEPVIETSSEPVSGQDGFRVQIGSFSTMEAAHSFAKVAKQKLSLPVFIKEVDGSFKVAAGQAANREEAEKLRNAIWALGYADAFIIPAQVAVP